MKIDAFFLVVFFSFVAIGTRAGQTVVHVADYGVIPDSRFNAEPVIRKILSDYDQADSLIIRFSSGRYDFWPAYRNENLRAPSVGFDLSGKKNIIIDGGGAEFVFHGKMVCFLMTGSQNIILKNFSIDWDRPFISQGTVVDCTDSYIDLEIDPIIYPYEIRNDSIYFFGEGWSSPITKNYNTIYDKDTKDIVYQTRDNPLGEIYNAKASMVGGNVVRFHFKPVMQPEKGTYVTLYHGAYIADGILMISSKNIFLEDINIYHTLSCGVCGYKSENISLKRVNIITNDKKNRAFSTVADATHFNGCKGEIIMDECMVRGAGDDCMNVHGMYAKVMRIMDDYSVLVAPDARYIGFEPDEAVWVVDTATMQRGETLFVKEQKAVYDHESVVGYQVVFSQRIEERIRAGNLLENIDKNPDVIIRDCHFLKQNRARGILVTTAGNVLIENNFFNSAGAAILIEGDMDLWFESGGVRNVHIINNVFENCYTSGNNILDKPWGWGEAPITITPSVQPAGADFPAYHKNIKIEHNTFKHYDYPLIYARSVDSLSFINNTIEKTGSYLPFYRKVNIFLDGCRNVRIGGNNFDQNFPGKNIFIQNMRKKDVSQFGKMRLNIESK